MEDSQKAKDTDRLKRKHFVLYPCSLWLSSIESLLLTRSGRINKNALMIILYENLVDTHFHSHINNNSKYFAIHLFYCFGNICVPMLFSIYPYSFSQTFSI